MTSPPAKGRSASQWCRTVELCMTRRETFQHWWPVENGAPVLTLPTDCLCLKKQVFWESFGNSPGSQHGSVKNHVLASTRHTSFTASIYYDCNTIASWNTCLPLDAGPKPCEHTERGKQQGRRSPGKLGVLRDWWKQHKSEEKKVCKNENTFGRMRIQNL